MPAGSGKKELTLKIPALFTSFTNLVVETDLSLNTASGTITVTGNSREEKGLRIHCSSPDVFRQTLKTVRSQGVGPFQANRFLRKLPSAGQNLTLTVADQELFRIHNEKLTIQYTRLLPYAGTILFG